MREIKFRGIDEEGIWRYGSVASTISTSGEYYGVEPFLFSLIIELEYQDKIELWRYPVKPETVGQYTGINDMDGLEIFESDVLNWSCDIGVNKGILWEGVVFWSKEDCSFKINMPSGEEIHLSDMNDYSYKKIIGNVYNGYKNV